MCKPFWLAQHRMYILGVPDVSCLEIAPKKEPDLWSSVVFAVDVVIEFSHGMLPMVHIPLAT